MGVLYTEGPQTPKQVKTLTPTLSQREREGKAQETLTGGMVRARIETC